VLRLSSSSSSVDFIPPLQALDGMPLTPHCLPCSFVRPITGSSQSRFYWQKGTSACGGHGLSPSVPGGRGTAQERHVRRMTDAGETRASASLPNALGALPFEPQMDLWKPHSRREDVWLLRPKRTRTKAKGTTTNLNRAQT
jgi:hypothetical protein